jgi:hypothetical protein
MKNILIVLPTGWDVEKIRYTQFGEEPYIVDADLIDSPLDDPDSLLNYHSKVLKLNGPTGFKL